MDSMVRKSIRRHSVGNFKYVATPFATKKCMLTKEVNRFFCENDENYVFPLNKTLLKTENITKSRLKMIVFIFKIWFLFKLLCKILKEKIEHHLKKFKEGEKLKLIKNSFCYFIRCINEQVDKNKRTMAYILHIIIK